MNWKSSLILLCLFSSLSWANGETRHYQTYQRLQIQLQKDPVATLDAIEIFVKQVQSANEQSQQMAEYLQLQACITLNRYSCAAASVERLISLTHDDKHKPELLRLSAQLHYQTQDFYTVITRVNQWVIINQNKENQPPAKEWAELYSLQAYSLYQQQRYSFAIKAMVSAIAKQKTEQREVFLLGLYQQLADWHNVNRVLQSLVSNYAYKAEYWEKYAYSFLKLKQEQHAIHVLGSAYKANRLPKQSIVLYAQLLMQFGVPERAAKVLESHPELTKNPIYNPLLTQSYLLSRDKLKASKWLAKLDKKDNYITQGLLAYQQGRWQQAITFLNQLDIGQKHNHYWLLLTAISEFELQHWDKARIAFQHLAGTNYDELSAQWLNQIDYLTRSE